MSVQTCYRDQRKIGHMIDQIKMLTNNLDELRAEIGALKASYLESKEYLLYGNDFKMNRNKKSNVLHKIKKYMKKVANAYSMRRGQKSDKSQTAYYPCSNLNRPLPPFLNYIFRISKKGDEWQIPTRIKYLKNQGNQTKENFKIQQSIVNNRTVFAPLKTTSFSKLENKQYNNIFPTKNITTVPNYSDISCELDLKVQDPVSPSNSERSTFLQNYRKNRNSSLLSNNSKRTTTKSTQTRIGKSRRKNRNSHIDNKYPNLSLSKIKNAVVMKKVVRNSNESTFTVCGDVNDRKSRRYSKRNVCKRCTCRKERSQFVNSINQETNESFVNDEKCENVLFEEEPNLSSSSVSVDLEVNISNDSVEMDEFSQRKKPRTYVIRKTTAKHDQNNHFERSVIYVGQTSDLTLSSSNVSNHTVSFN
ncbi:hypothetical protein ANTQUA_LOCUS7024 [Anthophora quadrimaculata]